MSHLLKNLIIVLVVVILFGGVYMFMNSGMVGTGGETQGDANIEARANEIVNNTRKINSYKIDTSIFEDTRFSTLQDYHVAIPDVATGRTNPFETVN